MATVVFWGSIEAMSVVCSPFFSISCLFVWYHAGVVHFVIMAMRQQYNCGA